MERGARSNESTALGPGDEILGLRFVEAGWVGEGEYDWALDMGGHFADDFFGEGPGDGGAADQDVWFDLFDDGEEVDFFTVGGEFIVVSGEGSLGRGEFVALTLDAQSEFVDKPNVRSNDYHEVPYQICLVASSLDFPSKTSISRN